MKEEEKEFDPLRIIGIGAWFIVLVLLILTGIDNSTKPATKYYIDADQGNYYTNSYQTDSGFIELNDYYQGFVWYSHYTKELILQGNIKITEEKNK